MCVMTTSFLWAQGISQTISADDFEHLIRTKERVQLVDVRTPGEFNNGHLDGAENVNYNDRKFMEEMLNSFDRRKPLFIYCLSGGRSGSALEELSENGFTEIYNLDGGIMAWKSAGKPLTDLQSVDKNSGWSMDEFKRQVNGDLPVLVEYYASWCKPCKMMKPFVEDIAKEYEGKIKVLYIDVDKHSQLSDELDIHSIPVLHYYKKGRLRKTLNGYQDKQAIRRMIQ